MTIITSPAFRYHGGKFRLSPWVQQHLPPHRTYVEPFGGAAGVLLTKPRSYAEVYNDLDGDVVNLFRVLQAPGERDRLIDACQLTPYARAEFDNAWEPTTDPVERARRLLVRAQMGFGSAGATKGATGFRIDSQRAYGTAQRLWSRFPPSLAAVAERFTDVLIENRPAVEVMRQHDAPQTLHYVDPPYVHSTRVMQAGKAGYYRHEMTEADHQELLDCLRSLVGMVVVSGYRTELYDAALAGWRRVETRARISAGRGCKVRTECLWISPACAATGHQGALQLGGAA
ncbi:DNA adenine methylase [Xanthomonas sp. PPL568]|uniref:DNA adenine methylase n=1 Tax=Xanthomonas indica TaxID=2912242 RepID=UPI001F5AC346|nr:DNA adenine methylase [Xanthomonas indica]MCI2243256.1 DNA adenine methylase [Xanthomonas indica]